MRRRSKRALHNGVTSWRRRNSVASAGSPRLYPPSPLAGTRSQATHGIGGSQPSHAEDAVYERGVWEPAFEFSRPPLFERLFCKRHGNTIYHEIDVARLPVDRRKNVSTREVFGSLTWRRTFEFRTHVALGAVPIRSTEGGEHDWQIRPRSACPVRADWIAVDSACGLAGSSGSQEQMLVGSPVRPARRLKGRKPFQRG